MKQRKHFSRALFSLTLVCGMFAGPSLPAAADEGMWMTGNLPSGAYDAMRSLGFKLQPEALYNTEGTALQGAVVLFGGFCTGVVVSPEGLVLTNHHCGFSSIHSHSTPEHDYLHHGFYAQTGADEWPVPGLYVSFPVRTDCVTSRVAPLLVTTDSTGQPHQVWGERRTAVIDSLQKVMEGEVLAEDSTLRADLVSYFGGNDFYLNVYRDYTDVRLVMAPPISAGKFGGETDNWMWPRETCDFSVFRIYAAPDGRPASYSPDNRPLKPKTYVPISTAGYSDGDFSMTMGFPGSTYRYLSSYGIANRMTAVNEPVIQVRTLKQYIWRQAMDRDSVVRLKYDNKYVRSANFWKNSIGMNRSLKEKNVIGEKQKFERNLFEWVRSDTAMERKYGTLDNELRSAYEKATKNIREAWFYSETFFGPSDLLSLAMDIVGGKFDKGNPACEKSLAKAETLYRDFYAPLDRATLAALMRNLLEQIPAEKLPSCYVDVAEHFGGSFTNYVDDIYSRSLLTDSARTLSLLRKGRISAFRNDPMLKLAHSVLSRMGDFAGSGAQERSEAERRLQEAVREMYARSALYPDANMTVRLSYGTVCSYDPEPGLTYPLFTTPATLERKVERQAEVSEYFMEPELMKLLKSGNYGRYADKRSGTLQLCFISNNDITGGNSGSPVFNGRGELMGLAFDGNWESMANDLKYDPAMTRCINVDIRYVLFLMQHWTKADRLIREMDLRQ